MRVRAADRAAAPPGADGPVQYRPRIAAVIVYLYAGQFLSKQRTAQALAELFGVPLSSGDRRGADRPRRRAAGRVPGARARPDRRGRGGRVRRDRIPRAGPAAFRVQGRLHWVHCARTGKYTLLMVHPKRGTEAMKAMGVLGSFAGVAVHDAWAPYDTYTGPEHQMCCGTRPPRAAGRHRRRARGPVVQGRPGRRGAHRDAGPGARGDPPGP
jgi:transposase